MSSSLNSGSGSVNDDNNQHARDENLRVGNFITGAETLYSLLTTPYSR